ncbi:MAG: acyltransferase [Muribaculaceae bacterium]|nr:acyltransferase [Muribaculaceae bacterium]
MTTTENTYTPAAVPAEFEDIAPYDDAQYQEKLASLIHEPGFEHAVRYVLPDVNYPEFADSLLKVKNQHDFQQNVMGPFLEMLVKTTTAGLSCDGLENILPDRNYTFITNHRDIVLDASFLNLCFIRRKMPITQVAIGNNLLIYDWITDLVKLNRSFIVKRDVRMVDALAAARQLSAYIHYVVNDRHESVWIAQREGRAKDSNDVTQESLIKMIGLAPDEDAKSNILGANLLPVSISYEFDPNDYLKVREFLLRRRDPDFKKSQRDDLFSMETGLLSFKGRVHMRIGKCINPELEAADTPSRLEAVREACRLIDLEIHDGYELFPCNYIAYDRVNETDRFAQKYSESDVNSFREYINRQLDRVDLPDITPEEREYMQHMMLTMYANPVKNQLAARGEADTNV